VLLGIARAANATGDRQKASEYYGKLVNLANNADTERPAGHFRALLLCCVQSFF
jgi:hypothetical protein